MDAQEQQFVRGFNHGYLLTKHEPNLVGQLIKTLKPTTDYLDGFLSGKEEWELEHSEEQLNELRHLREKGKERGHDLDKEQ